MAYAHLSEVRGWLGIRDGEDDPEMGYALDSAASAIDTYCGFKFTLDTTATAKVFRPSHHLLLDIAAAGFTIADVTGLIVKSDDNDDGTYETTWTSADYQLEPFNGRGAGGEAWPYTALRAVGNYQWPVGGVGRATVQITAVWGWSAVPARVRQAAVMLTAAWHQRRATISGRGGFEGFFASTIQDDQTITDLLAPYRHGDAVSGMA